MWMWCWSSSKLQDRRHSSHSATHNYEDWSWMISKDERNSGSRRISFLDNKHLHTKNQRQHQPHSHQGPSPTKRTYHVAPQRHRPGIQSYSDLETAEWDTFIALNKRGGQNHHHYKFSSAWGNYCDIQNDYLGNINAEVIQQGETAGA